MDRQVKGIWIPIEIWEARNLSWNEKILLMEIDSYTSKGKECYISNEFISHLLGVTERQASKYLSRLIELDYVKVVKFNGRQRFVESTLTYFQAEWNKSSMQSRTKVPDTNNKNTYKSSINIEDNSNPAFDFKSSLIGLGVSPEVATEWMKVRRAKRAVNSDIALKAIEREIKKSGLSADDAIRIAVERSWSGFDASWILKEKSSQPQHKESVLEHNIKVYDQLFGTHEHERIYGRKEADYEEQ